ncbi:MAG: VOC family protein [Nitrolancea sp.]
MSGSFQLKTKPELNHVALKVTDMSRAIHFYSEVIGLPVTRTRGPEGDPDAVWLPGVQLVKGESGLSPSGTLDHVALGVDNLEELCQRLDSMGVKVDRSLAEIPGSDGKPFALAAFYYDPDGNRVEIFKYL